MVTFSAKQCNTRQKIAPIQVLNTLQREIIAMKQGITHRDEYNILSNTENNVETMYH